jgi:hypothetical protein
MHANSVVHGICRIRSRRDLNLAPLAVGRHDCAFERAFLEFLIDTLLVNTAFSLDERRFWRKWLVYTSKRLH